MIGEATLFPTSLSVDHPAVYSDPILMEIRRVLHELDVQGPVCDVMAGTGKIHRLTGYETWGVEIEPEWAFMSARNIQGNALSLPFRNQVFAAIVVSPTYSNRMADSHDAQDESVRHTYTHVLGRKLHPDNSGAMQWGQSYRDFHQKAWSEALRVLRSPGWFLLNCKDHQRNWKRMHVTNWHYQTLKLQGLSLEQVIRIPTSHYGFGENHESRYMERLLVFQNR